MITIQFLLIASAVVLAIMGGGYAVIKVVDNFGPMCGSAMAIAFLTMCVMFGLMMVKWRYF